MRTNKISEKFLININDVPQFLINSELFKSLDKMDNEYLDITNIPFKENLLVYDEKDFDLLARVLHFWQSNDVILPNETIKWCLENHIVAVNTLNKLNILMYKYNVYTQYDYLINNLCYIAQYKYYDCQINCLNFLAIHVH